MIVANKKYTESRAPSGSVGIIILNVWRSPPRLG